MPKGQLYGGAETTQKLPLNALTKGLANIFLGLLSRHFGGSMDYSFGKFNSDDVNDSDRIPTNEKKHKRQNEQRILPHISFPLQHTMDTIVITRHGESPPTLEKPLAVLTDFENQSHLPEEAAKINTSIKLPFLSHF